jgi:hypothetical protein
LSVIDDSASAIASNIAKLPGGRDPRCQELIFDNYLDAGGWLMRLQLAQTQAAIDPMVFILPDLHQIAATRTRIAVIRDDDELLSLPLPFPVHVALTRSYQENANARRMRAFEAEQISKCHLELGSP